MLSGFFDESERTDANEPITIAGYIFKPTGYRHFCRKWGRMLECGPTATPHFHMTDLYNHAYAYEGWSVDQRVEVLRQAVDGIRKHAYCGICVMVSQAEFERVAPPHWRIQYGSIYSAMCQLALRTTAFLMDRRGNDDLIAYSFESGHRFWDEASSLLAGFAYHPERERLYRYHSHSAVTKRDAYGLQAADMLAWTVARLVAGVPKNHSMAAFAPVLHHLMDQRGDRYQATFLEGDRLRRFFDGAGDGPVYLVPSAKARKMRLR